MISFERKSAQQVRRKRKRELREKKILEREREHKSQVSQLLFNSPLTRGRNVANAMDTRNIDLSLYIEWHSQWITNVFLKEVYPLFGPAICIQDKLLLMPFDISESFKIDGNIPEEGVQRRRSILFHLQKLK